MGRRDIDATAFKCLAPVVPWSARQYWIDRALQRRHKLPVLDRAQTHYGQLRMGGSQL